MPNARPRHPAMLRTARLGIGLTVAAMLATVAPGIAETPEPPVRTSTFAGAFLAGNAARADKDFGAAASYFDRALRFDPGNMDLQREYMVSLITSGQIDRALAVAEQLKDVPDVERIARLVIGMDAIRKGQWDAADNALVFNEAGDLERIVTGVMRAWARHGAGQTQAAIEALDALEGPDWYSLFVLYHTALLADAGGMEDEAERRLSDGMNDANGGGASPLTYVRMGDAYARFLARHGRKDEALAVLDRALGAAPNNPDLIALRTTITEGRQTDPKIVTAAEGAAEILLNIGSAINRDGAEEFAALYLELARSGNPADPQIVYELGGIAERLGQPEKAIEFYGAVSAESPLHRIAALQQGLALSDLDRSEEAVATLTQLVADNPDDFRGYLALGGVHASLKQYEESGKVYKAAIDRLGLDTAEYWQFHYRLGISYERTKRWPEAEAAFKRALELSPDQPDVLNYLGYSWIDMNINLEEGLEMIRKAVAIRPRDGYIVDSLGWAYYRLGRFEEAVAELEKATELRAHDPLIIDHLGDAYWRVGRKLEATYQWSQTLELEADDLDKAKIRAKLEAANTPGGKPDIAVSIVDTAPTGEAATGNGG